MKCLMEITLLFLMLFVSSCHSGEESEKKSRKQRMDTLKFVEYKDFESAYKSGRDLKLLSKDFNLFSVLLLDSTMAKAFFEINPELRENVYYASLASRLCESRLGFVTESETLRDVFLSKASRNRIFNCVGIEESVKLQEFLITSPVYIKENTAIVEISTTSRTFYSTYYITLLDRVVQINLLGSVIEN